MVGDARGDVDLELLLGTDAAVALTLGAGLLNHRPLPGAAGAGRHGHELSEHRACGAPHFARPGARSAGRGLGTGRRPGASARGAALQGADLHLLGGAAGDLGETELQRSEEHTSELQSRLHLVCRLLLEKKKKTQEILGTNNG